MVVYTWEAYEANAIEVIKPRYILSFAYKWLGGEVKSRGICDYPGYRAGKDDKALMKELREIMDAADVIVAHNGDQFDIKRINARFIFHHIPLPSTYRTVDTKKIARARCGFAQNSLNALAKELSLGEKADTGGFKTWKGCMEGDMASWKAMKKYNEHDVELLEKVYLELRAIDKNHPNIGLDESCPKCQSNDVIRRGKERTKLGLYPRFSCNNCASWFRSTKLITIVATTVPV